MSKCSRDVIVAKLRRLGACKESLAWVRSQPRDATIATLWVACPIATWMIWLRSTLAMNSLDVMALWQKMDMAREDFAIAWPVAIRKHVGWTGFYDIKKAWEALP